VGVTRAMDELYLTSCMMRRMYGKTSPMQPSLFLHEIDASCLKISGAGGIAASYVAKSKANAELEKRAGWRIGQRLFHEDHGYGAIVGIEDSEDGPLVRVRFDSGQEKRFLSEIQGRAYEKIDDY